MWSERRPVNEIAGTVRADFRKTGSRSAGRGGAGKNIFDSAVGQSLQHVMTMPQCVEQQATGRLMVSFQIDDCAGNFLLDISLQNISRIPGCGATGFSINGPAY
jgi:hypothetical protein